MGVSIYVYFAYDNNTNNIINTINNKTNFSKRIVVARVVVERIGGVDAPRAVMLLECIDAVLEPIVHQK
jgi:hypothetical protein